MSRYLAIDIDPQGLFVVAGSARGGAAKVEHALAWTAGPDGTGGPPALTPETAKAVGEQLRDRLKAANIPAAPVLVAVGRDRLILKELKFPPVAPAEEPALVRFQALKEITEAPDDVVLDYAPLPSADPRERRAMAVVVRKDFFTAIQGMCTAAGLKLATVSPRPYAVAAGQARAVAMGAAEKPESPTDAAAVLTLGPQGGEFTVVRGGQVALTRTIPGPVAASEPMLVAEVRRNVAIDAGGNAGGAVQTVYVAESGGGPLARKLRAALALPTHPYDPLAGAVDEVPTTLRGRFAGAAGLLAGRAAEALPVNFAAPRQPKVETNPQQTKILIGVLAAVVLLAGGALVGFMKLGAADRKLRQLAAEKQDLDAELARLDPETAKATAVRAWAGQEVNWLDELYDMAARFPIHDARATVFTAVPLRSTDPKKPPEAQAKVELRVVSRGPAAANEIIDGMVADNPPGKPYYLDTQRIDGGTAPGNAAFREVFSIVAKVMHRAPAAYTRPPVATNGQ